MKKSSLFLLMGMIFMGGSACYAGQLPAGGYQQSCWNCTYTDGATGGTLSCDCATGKSYNAGAYSTAEGYNTVWQPVYASTHVNIPSAYKGTVSNQFGKLVLDKP